MSESTSVRELYVAWLAPEHPRWYTVGHLYAFDERYAFEYTEGFRMARRDAGMRPIFGFPEAETRYVSDALFPLFTNRLMRPSRPDYGHFVHQLGLDESAGPLDILARSEGYRATDYFRVYARPRAHVTPGGSRYRLAFLVTGLRFRTDRERERAADLQVGERLSLVPEPENPFDPYAHRLDSDDGFCVGYVPRYFAPDLVRLGRLGASLTVRVKQNNFGRAPFQRALLCAVDGPWPDSFRALDTIEHHPIRAEARVDGAPTR